MDKLTLAHDYAMQLVASPDYNDDMSLVEFVDHVWKYADAMQAEADKRSKAEAEQKRKEMREMLNAPNTFVEREGQHFDDVYQCEVDWRVAPTWAKYWAFRDGSSALWCTSKPTWADDCLMSHGVCTSAPSFGFTGTHIVERPQ